MTGFSQKVARQAFERDGEACFRCRMPLLWEYRGSRFSIHHRRPRGSGGTSDPVVNSVANALTLCGTGVTGCHGWVESHRTAAEELGYLIRRESRIATPTGTPVRRKDGTLWLLRADGVAEQMEEQEEEDDEQG